MPEDRSSETRCIHGGQDRKDTGLAPPIFPASVYAFASLQESIDTFEGRRQAPLYARYGHPTGEEVEARITSLEGAEACILTASGVLWNAEDAVVGKTGACPTEVGTAVDHIYLTTTPDTLARGFVRVIRRGPVDSPPSDPLSHTSDHSPQYADLAFPAGP